MTKTDKSKNNTLYLQENRDFIVRLLGGITQESRNFLNAVLSITEALALEVSNNPYFKPFLDHMKLQIDKLWSLVDELTELKKCFEPLNIKKESLISFIDSIDRMLHDRFTSTKHLINIKLPSKIDKIYLNCDLFKLTQTVGYLLENAIQHSPEGTDVKVLFKVSKRALNIYIIDKGEGISPENKDRIFFPFFTTKIGHRGFGLKFAKIIIISHNGNINIYSNTKKQGCTAKIILPVIHENLL